MWAFHLRIQSVLLCIVSIMNVAIAVSVKIWILSTASRISLYCLVLALRELIKVEPFETFSVFRAAPAFITAPELLSHLARWNAGNFEYCVVKRLIKFLLRLWNDENLKGGPHVGTKRKSMVHTFYERDYLLWLIFQTRRTGLQWGRRSALCSRRRWITFSVIPVGTSGFG